jgi:CCR4-NOT transcription complex subunit 7/8
MAPPVSRYPPQNLSNPFAHLNQQPLHQASHMQHQNPSLQAHNLGGHHGFSAAGQNSLSLFGPQSTNGNIPGGFGGAGGNLGAGGATNGLASQAAQMGFAHGGNLQLQQAQEAAASVASRGANQRIREVWKNNLHQEMATIRHLVDRYPYISMACFPSTAFVMKLD